MSRRLIVNILQELCRERSIEFNTYSYDWVIEMKQGDLTKRVIGYKTDLNSMGTSALCVDKSACSEILSKNNIPCVEHTLLMSEQIASYVDGYSEDEILHSFTKKHAFPYVIKPNEGTTGRDIHIVHNEDMLHTKKEHLFQPYSHLALSPYEHIDGEYRIVIVNGDTPLIYKKTPPKNGWQHNLSQGATASFYIDATLSLSLITLAKEAAETVQLKFGAIDIIDTPEGLKIMEINSGAMFEKLVQQHPEKYAEVKRIYNLFLDHLFTSK